MLAGRASIWIAFVVVHAALVALCLTAPGFPMGDVDNFYRLWAENAQAGLVRMGIDAPWVYPILAFLPMAAAQLLTFGVFDYGVAWLGVVVALNAVTFGFLLGRRRLSATRRAAAWWWLAFLALLGPIALARIDAVTVSLAMLAGVFAAGRPRIAAALLTIAAWVKVWPVALGLALVIASRRRLEVVLVALIVSIAVTGGTLLAGGGAAQFGFVTAQTDRGLQVEAPLATFWLWMVVAGVPGAAVRYSQELNTFEVAGPGVDGVAAASTPLLAIGVAVIVLLAIRALLRGAGFATLFPATALALVTVLIALNKVGSPQFIGWLAVPVVLIIVFRKRDALIPAALALAIAALTQLFYPYWYDWLLAASPAFVLVLTARNLLELVLLGWAVAELWRSGRSATNAVGRD